MYIKRSFKLKGILVFSGFHMIWLTLMGAVDVFLYEILEFKWLAIPWLPISLIGTAVAFYVGFKNNSAYDRMWEARKIWGAIVNDSRSLGITVKHFATSVFQTSKTSEQEINALKKRIIYRHIAWLYTLRDQLLIATPWEHINASKHIKKLASRRIEKFGTGLLDAEDSHDQRIQSLLDPDELVIVNEAKNRATRLIDHQAEAFKKLRENGLVDDFRHMEMQKILFQFYTHQGKCERIKNYPLPRQYASTSAIFVGIFVFLLPFGLLPEFSKLGESWVWLTVPFTTLVGWVFIMMELVGDYSENPFEGMGNDIPMMSLCRTIEIDLRQMLDEKELPAKIEAANNILM